MTKLKISTFFLAIGASPFALPINRNLEYEYSLSLGVLLILSALVIGQFQRQRKSLLTHRSAIVWGIIPLSLTPGLWYFTGHCQCYPQEISLWLLAQTLPAWFLFWGILQGMQLLDGLNPIFRRILKILIVFLGILLPLAELWLLPQKRLTGIFTGILHGPIYDTWIPGHEGNYWLRTIHGSLGISLWLTGFRQRTIQFLAGIACITLLLTNTILSLSPEHGHGQDALNETLHQEIVDPDFTLHHPIFKTAQQMKKVHSIFRQARFHVQDLKKNIPNSPHVHIYVYESSDQKKILFGGGGTDVTDVVTPSIHINLSSWPHPTLRHELVHAMASSNAYFGLGFHPNMAFTEGLAVALAPTEQTLSLDQSVSIMNQQGKLPNLETLFSPMFWTVSGRRAYTASGSLVYYLGQTYGVPAILSLYNGQSWLESLGQGKKEVIQSWLAHIKLEDSEAKRASYVAEALFRYPGLFHDKCPHSKALLKRVRKKLNPQWRQPEDWTWQHYVQWRQKIEPGAARVQFMAQKLEARKLFNAKDHQGLKQFISKYESKTEDIKYLEDFWLLLLLSDLHLELGQMEQAKEAISKLHDYQKTSFIGFPLERQLSLRRHIYEQEFTEQSKAIMFYLGGLKKWKQVPKNDSWIYKYLRIRRGSKLSSTEPESLLDQSPPKFTTQNLRFEWYRTLGTKYMNMELWEQAKLSFQSASAHAHKGSLRALEIYTREAEWQKSINIE